MKNLELKVKISAEHIQKILKRYEPAKILEQTDTYYKISDGRLKIREQDSKETKRVYAIKYNRPDTLNSKMSNYYTFDIGDLKSFKKVFGDVLIEEFKVKKKRTLILIKNARIHLDSVCDLGTFLEIEIVINTEEELENSKKFMETLIRDLELGKCEKIKFGYREMMILEKSATKATIL